MRDVPSISAADQEFLDGLLEQAIERLEQDNPLDIDALLGPRAHLRIPAEAVIRLAREVAVGRSSHVPRVRGYSILKEIGSGGMGSVYLARQDRVAGRLVALKVLPAASALSNRARERFVREAESLARLQHPNVITIFDVVHSGGVFAYAMEYIEGQSLADWIDSRVRCTHQSDATNGQGTDPAANLAREKQKTDPGADVPFLCRIGIAIARALAAVHAAGLLHRDVKPSNILLRRDDLAVLTDFGLARETNSTVTQPGHFAGTPAYSPPEQLRGEIDRIDPRSDVYSLGVTLYHALSLRLPFDGDRPSKLLSRIETGQAAPLRRLNTQLPRDLETIIAKAIDADPGRRYQSADDFADDLDRLLTLRPIKARPAGLATRTLKLARRNRRSLAAAVAGALVALALAAAAVIYTFFVPRWVEGHVRDARLALLDPGQANDIVSTLYWDRTSPYSPQQQESRRRVFDQALAAYDAALRWSPFDEAIREERHVVEMAREIQPQSLLHSPPSRSLSATADRGARPPRRVASSLRSEGLYAYLTRDYQAAIDAWTRWEQSRDPLAEPDPLVDAALGVLYLFDNQSARAYPRLQKAVESFGEVGFLLEYLADAAAKCGDTQRARRWLEQSRHQSRRDEFEAGKRIDAAILAAEGKTSDAIAAYRQCKGFGLPQMELAELLEREGRLEEAITEFTALDRRFPHSIRLQHEFQDCADRWWSSQSPRHRLRRIRRSLDELPYSPDSFVALLRQYQAATSPDPGSASSLLFRPSVSWPLDPSDSLSNIFFFPPTALLHSFFSPSLQSLSLSELAIRMEVTDMSLCHRISAHPRILKELQFTAWRFPRLAHLLNRIQEICNAVRTMIRYRPRAAATTFVLASALVPSTIWAQPIVEYRFDEGSGSIAANTGSAGAPANGALSGPGWSGDTPSGSGFSLQFDGLDDRVAVPNAFGYANQITVEAWIKPDDVSGFHVVWDDYGNPGVILAVVNGELQWGISTTQHPDSGIAAYGGTIVVGEWQHVAGTYDGASIIAYVNGCPVDGAATSGPIIDNINNFDAGIGSDNPPNPPALLFDGLIDDLRIFPGALAVGDLADGQFGPTPPCFTGLGDLPGGAVESFAWNVSADGSTVVGQSKQTNGPEAFRWRAGLGMTGLGDLPGADFRSQSSGVSADGNIVGGGSSSAASCDENSFRLEGFSWTESGGLNGLGAGNSPLCVSYATGVSDDGQIFSGFIRVGPLSEDRMAYWTSTTGWVWADTISRGDGISHNGQWIVGTIGPNQVSAPAARWLTSAGFEIMPGNVMGTAYAASDTGDAVGADYGSGQAFLWMQTGNTLWLGDFVGGAFSSVAYSITADGAIIVGRGTSTLGAEAAIWDESLVMRRATEVLSASGVSIPTGWVLSEATDVTVNGTVVTLCGNGTNPQGNPEAWIARYTLPPACDAPQVSQHPQGATIAAGATANFTVAATGTAPLSYQWRKNSINLNDGASGCSSTISGATTANLTISNVSTTDNASYDCVVTNACGSDSSDPATLTVPQGPACAGDMDGNNMVDGNDIAPFIAKLLAGGTCP